MKRKKIYISRSMLTDVALIDKLASKLSQNGFNPSYYIGNNESYSDKDIKTADLVLVLPYKHSGVCSEFGNVGKGQHSEVLLALKLNIPVYFITNDGQMYSVTSEYELLDVNSWKKDYAKFEVTSFDGSLYKWLQTTFNPVTKIVNDLLLIVDITE